MEAEKNEILDLIIYLIKGIKNGNSIECDGLKLWNSKYLLNQVIRQYSQPNKYFYVSEKASALWNKITTKKIMDFFYHDKVELDLADGSIALKCYTGNSNSYTEWTPKKGDKLTYRDVFHDEHIVPIKVIINELINLEVLDYKNVKNVLGKIRICKMLKEEDKMIGNKSNRSLDYIEAFKENYAPAGIVCTNVETGEVLK